MNLPRITIVTCSFNQGEFLEATIQSVLGQNYPNLEYIIIDGGSSDNSVEIIKRYEKSLYYWQSKPDKGQYCALHEGFARATGVLMNWVNSDDLLAPGALDHVARLYQDCPEAGILACSMEHFTRTPADACDKVTPQGWSPEGFLRVPKQGAFSFNQPGVFFTRYLYERIGGLDRPLHMCMDYDLFLRMSETGPRIVYSSRTTAFFRHHAGSKTTCGMVKNLIREHAEFLQIYNDAFRRTGIAADRSRSVNLLHWWLFRAAWHADFANMRLAYQALAELDHRSPRDISGRIGVLLLRRLFQGSRV